MTKARNLPAEVLLDALAHLPPADIDGSLRFTSHAYRSLVERWGNAIPKHTVVLEKASPPPAAVDHPSQQRQSFVWWLLSFVRFLLSLVWQCFCTYKPTIGWCSFEGGGRAALALHADGLRALLRSERLGRVTHVSIAAWQEDNYHCWEQCDRLLDVLWRLVQSWYLSYAWKLSDYRLSRGDKFLELLGHGIAENADQPKFACVEMHHPRVGFYHFFSPKYCPASYQIHHFPMQDRALKMVSTAAPFYLAENDRGGGGPKEGEAIHLVYSISSLSLLWGILAGIHQRFTNAPPGYNFRFLPGGELLMHCSDDLDGWTLNWEGLGPPDEPRRRVGKWQLATAAPHNASGDDQSLAAFRDYYRRLEGCEWRVWRVRNPHLPDGEKYLRVMQKLPGKRMDNWTAFYLKVFDVNEDGREMGTYESDIV